LYKVAVIRPTATSLQTWRQDMLRRRLLTPAQLLIRRWMTMFYGSVSHRRFTGSVY